MILHPSRLTAAGSARRRRRIADEAGSFLVEAVVSALIVLIAGAGILKMMDRGSQLSSEQKTAATAAAFAEAEQERLRGYQTTKEGIAVLAKLRYAGSRDALGVRYSITSRTDWLNDASGAPNCTTNAAPADYMQLTTTVTYPSIGTRKPVTLHSIISPPARAFDANQGSLAVSVVDSAGNPVSGLTLALTGPATLSDTTNANGCILWGYLPAGSGYTISGANGGYVQPDGNAAISEPATVTGDQTNNVNLRYARAGGVAATFTTQRSAAAATTATVPGKAMVEHSDAKFVARAFTLTGSSLSTGAVLFPFASPPPPTPNPLPYSIYADGCTSARPPVANLGAAAVLEGSTSATATVQVPALNVIVKSGPSAVAGASVKVTSACGSAYSRTTDTSGILPDPGFPYAPAAAPLNVCVSLPGASARRYATTLTNTSYPGTDVTFTFSGSTAISYRVGTAAPVNATTTTGACP